MLSSRASWLIVKKATRRRRQKANFATELACTCSHLSHEVSVLVYGLLQTTELPKLVTTLEQLPFGDQLDFRACVCAARRPGRKAFLLVEKRKLDAINLAIRLTCI